VSNDTSYTGDTSDPIEGQVVNVSASGEPVSFGEVRRAYRPRKSKATEDAIKATQPPAMKQVLETVK